MNVPRPTEERPDHSKLPHSRLDALLDEAADAERSRPPVDAERFLARLRGRLIPIATRPLLAPALAAAAIIPLALCLWLLFADTGPDPAVRDAEFSLIEELDVLEILAELTPEEIDEIDPGLFDLYLNWEIIDELPVETLENS
jgi:hypothetical protein